MYRNGSNKKARDREAWVIRMQIIFLLANIYIPYFRNSPENWRRRRGFATQKYSVSEE